MRGMHRLRLAGVITVVAIAMGALAAGAMAWDGHDLITFYALRDVPELAKFTRITPRSYSYGDLDQDKYNPGFEIKYIAGEGVGPLSALQILTSYAAEPDWGLDQDIELHPLQYLTGGSHGWRHQRYILLNGLVTLGVAPQRVEHFYTLAVEAYRRGDLYWAFRFLARALHYLQDLGQPLHALPMPERDIVTKYRFDFGHATTAGNNVHHNTESFIGYHLQSGRPNLVAAIKGKDTEVITSARKAAVELNHFAKRYAEEQYRLSVNIWPEFEENRKVELSRADFIAAGPKEKVDKLLEIAARTLAATGRYSRGLVRQFLQDTGLLGAT
ncbi:MAG TPA: hypothetical protein GX506_07095 [Firmicutes bacterium]|nr:hypothetical protein [Bacillota bacterium]